MHAFDLPSDELRERFYVSCFGVFDSADNGVSSRLEEGRLSDVVDKVVDVGSSRFSEREGRWAVLLASEMLKDIPQRSFTSYSVGGSDDRAQRAALLRGDLFDKACGAG
jgi:hypothetical protein